MALNAFDVGFAISVFDRASGPLNRIRSSYRTLNLETKKYEKRMMSGFKLLAGGYVAAASGMAALGAATKLAVQATDFQKQIDQLKIVASQSGVADSKLSGLRKTILAVASDTTFAADDLAKASRTFIQRGFAGVGTSDKGLRATAAFSEISLGQIGIGKAAEIGAQSIAAFRKEGESDFKTLNRVLAIAAFTGNNTALTFDKLPLVMGRIARSAAASGIEFSQLAMAAGKATDQLGSHRIASTGVATLLEQLSKGGKEAKLLKMFGLEGKQIREVKGGLSTLIDAMTAQMGSQFSDTDAINMGRRIAKALDISPKNVSILTGAALAAKNAKKPFSDFVKAAEEAGRAGMKPLQDLIEEEYYATIGGQIDLLGGKFKNFKILLGETLGPALGSITKLLNATFDTINEFLGDDNNFARLKAGAESFIKGAFISSITGLSALLTGAVLLLGPVIAPMIPLMVAMGAAITVITNNLGESFGGFRNLGTAIADAAKVMISGDDAFLGDKTSDRFNNANRVVKTLTSSFEFLKGVFEGIMTVVKPLVGLVEALVGSLKSLAGMFGGDGEAGGAGKVLGQVLMGSLLFRGAGKAMGLGGGAAAAMGGRGSARGVAAGRGRMSGSLFGLGAASGSQSLAASRALDTNPALGGSRMMWAVPAGGGLGKMVPAPASAKMRAATKSSATTRLGRIKGRAAGARMAGGVGIAGAIGGAALGQWLAPDSELVQVAAMLAMQSGAKAAAPKVASLMGAGLARAGMALGSAGLGGLISGGSVTAAVGGAGGGATLAVAGAAAGLTAFITSVGLASFAIGTYADRQLGFSDWISDKMAGVDSSMDTTKRGQVALGLRNVDIFGKDGKLGVGKKSKDAFLSRTGQAGQLAFGQREAGVNNALAVVDRMVNNEQLKVRNEMSADERDADPGGVKARAKARDNLLKSEDINFKKAVDNFALQEQLFKQMMENNKLLTTKQEEKAARVETLVAQGITVAKATKMAADAISGATFTVMIDGKLVGNANVEVMNQLSADSNIQGSGPMPQGSPGALAQDLAAWLGF